MSSVIPEATAAIKLIHLAHKQGWLDKLVTAFRKKHRIIVLGTTGVGKTNFLESLTEIVPKAIDVMNRTEFSKKNHIKILKHPFIFIDTPGQEMHKSRRLAAIREAMSNRISGVINVVSYGYHESRAIKKPTFGSDGTVQGDFLTVQRQNEIEAVHEWTPLLGDPNVAKWLITVVTKADLWWNQRDEVMTYYQTGPYHTALGPAQTLHPIVLEYGSVFQKFWGQGSMSGDFQDSDRVRAKAHLIQELLAAIGKTSKS